jgi:long-chain fatty acid transport protein
MRRGKLRVLAAVLVLAGALPAMASGFSIYEQSAKASGQAGAWVARADDAAANWYNPAALTRLDGMQIQFGVSLITIGIDTKLTSSDRSFGLSSPVQFKSKEDDATPIQLYCAAKINERLTFGFGLNNPFGLSTEWTDRPITFSSQRVELVTFVANPNLAIKLNEQWSLAVGVDYMWADVKEFSKEFDQSSLLRQPSGTIVGKSDLTGDGNAWGWNIATHFAKAPWSFGLTYRAKLSPEIKGNVKFSNVFHNDQVDLRPLFPNGPGKTTLDLPAEAAVGVGYELNDKWRLEGDVSFAQWSAFQKLAVDFQNNTSVPGPAGPIPVVADINQAENWKNTFAMRFGTTWKLSDPHEIRFGALWDQNPIPDDTLRPSIPDGDRWSVTLGYGYKAQSWSLDAYYMPLFFRTRNAKGATTGKPSATNPYQVVDGVIDGKYESFVHLIGASFTWRF